MSSEVLLEEFEVLESIYPDELSKLSERHIKICVEPDEIPDGEGTIKLVLHFEYGDAYPDTLPELSLTIEDGEIDDDETSRLVDGMRKAGEENIGMAMTFTIVSHLRDELTSLVRERLERRKREEAEKERKLLEEEEVRTRGTPVTRESFLEWKARFDKEVVKKKTREEEENLKALSPKEREEYKRLSHRPTGEYMYTQCGRQLFERNKSLDAEDSILEEGAISVDASQYERTRPHEEEEEDRVHFSDSD
ncbi:RWD-domain-containing protein [Vararia minispora EC-137]|uniref:RWD-domain-containing protein n=1 Tax=Vararia minispora EC-137 TaxID=1314806 RepID=A0ACB8QJI7_9AGAM|nr:RWD-domain-containing protein [Vararia minispora EC-137]